MRTDLILECCDVMWKLHLPYFIKAEKLSELYEIEKTKSTPDDDKKVCCQVNIERLVYME